MIAQMIAWYRAAADEDLTGEMRLLDMLVPVAQEMGNTVAAKRFKQERRVILAEIERRSTQPVTDYRGDGHEQG